MSFSILPMTTSAWSKRPARREQARAGSPTARSERPNGESVAAGSLGRNGYEFVGNGFKVLGADGLAFLGKADQEGQIA